MVTRAAVIWRLQRANLAIYLLSQTFFSPGPATPGPATNNAHNKWLVVEYKYFSLVPDVLIYTYMYMYDSSAYMHFWNCISATITDRYYSAEKVYPRHSFLPPEIKKMVDTDVCLWQKNQPSFLTNQQYPLADKDPDFTCSSVQERTIVTTGILITKWLGSVCIEFKSSYMYISNYNNNEYIAKPHIVFLF